MKRNVTEWDFIQEFASSDTYKNNFSIVGLKALYNFLTELEEDTDTEIEFDIVAICCDFTEYEDFEELKNTYSNLNLETLEDFEDYTTIIELDNGSIIIQNF